VGEAGSLLIRVNTQGDNLIITPYQDDAVQDALSAHVASSLRRDQISISWNTYRTLSFLVSITSHKDIEIREPWILRAEDG